MAAEMGAETPDRGGDIRARIEAAAGRSSTLARRWAGDWDGLRDQSRSGRAMSLGASIKNAGFDLAEMSEAMALHPDTSEWAQEAGSRGLTRIFDKANSRSALERRDEGKGLNGRAHDVAEGANLIAEDSVARAFAELHHDDLRYCHTAQKWNGAIWRREDTRFAFDLARDLAHELARDTESAKAIVSAERAAFAAGVERFAKADRAFAVTGTTWNSGPWLLGTPAGTVDLRTGELRTVLVQIAPTSKSSLPRHADFKAQAPRSRQQAQLGLERQDAPARTAPCGSDASARCR
jgi:hypothetical protein